MKITIGNKEYQVEEAKTELQRRKGLQDRESLALDKGMIFYYDTSQEVSMWMYKTDLALDIIFIGLDLKVISVKEGKPNSEDLITEKNVSYVLEVNKDSGIKKGDLLEFQDNDPVMKVLAPDGSDLMELWGGERIFRRDFTKRLIEKVKQANELRDDEELFELACKKIGKMMFKEIDRQDNQLPEYVTAP